ncbi:MAG: HD domain-containing protein [Clostridiaceae bacterium]
MKQDDLSYFKTFFFNYVEKFYSEDTTIQKNIILKRDHTLRVLKNMNIITEDLNLDQNSMLIAETIALFHDIGRFYQFNKYKTFSDKDSENHAELGVDILKSKKILNRLKDEEKDIIIKSIKYHNMYKLPINESNQCILFSKLIRDADKIDIYMVLTDYYKELDSDLNPALEHNLPKDESYSPLIIADILNLRNSNSKLIKTRYDMRLLTLTWIFDLNFKISFKLIKNHDYINKTLKVLPNNEDMDEIKLLLTNYIENKINFDS